MAAEYHIAIEATDYKAGEIFLPPIKEPKNIDGVEIKLFHADDPDAKAQESRIFGKITRDEKPVNGAWVSAWPLIQEDNAANCPMLRGRLVPSGGFAFQAALSADGKYSIEGLRPARYHILVQEPGQAPFLTQEVPLHKADREREVNVEITPGGNIEGKVAETPGELAGTLWVVAFNDNVFLSETRVGKDGRFSFKDLPPGHYGLKAGHDNYHESHGLSEEDSWKKSADPWKEAVSVTVESGKTAKDITVVLPEMKK